MAENNFLLPNESYVRSISPMKDWIRQTALYASKVTGKSFEACVKHLEAKLKSKQLPFTNPQVVFFKREENGDTAKSIATLSAYIQDTIKQNEILAPTFTTYLHPSVKRSLIVNLLDENVAARTKFKKLAHKHESEGNLALYSYNNQLQDSTKRQNNSVSGGFVSDGSVICNKSAHSTLTSTTRTIASISNASNERLIEGNRQYYTPQVTLNNLISIVAETDQNCIQETLSAYQLKAPTVKETMDAIHRSTDLYWKDRRSSNEIEAFISTLSDVERASIVYTGDLFHLRHLNDNFMREFISNFALVGDETPIEDPISFLYGYNEAIVNYAHQINMTMMRGKGKDYAKLEQREQYILANTCLNIQKTIEKYKLFLKAFFLTKNSPCTVATVPSMIRRAVVLSDTDSTMFSADNWVDWYFGRLDFTDRGFAVAGAVMFMATQAISHIIALFSANMNVEKSRLFTLAMKPEFVFPVFAQTSVAKHYYTAMLVKEGNVYKDIKMEIKGVHMKDSTVPTNIIKGAAMRMETVIKTVMEGKKISLQEVLNETANVEREILSSIYKGETTYLKRVKIKEAAAYKLEEERSPYQHYVLWNEVFASSYGDSPKPPYNAVRIPLDLPNRTSIKEWFDSIQDRALAERLMKWFADNNKQMFQSFPIPTENCKSHGIPEELRIILNSRKIVLTLTKSYRNILESLGYFPKADFLISEQINHPTAL